MNVHEYSALHILHVLSAILMVATVFYACAGRPETRVKALSWSGIAAVVSLLTGLRMWQGIYDFNGAWVLVKLVCWLGLAALVGLAYRKREKARLWITLASLLALVALVMVYMKPF